MNLDPELLKSFLPAGSVATVSASPAPVSKEKTPVPPAVPRAVKKVKPLMYKSFFDELGDDSAWLNEKLGQDRKLLTQIITVRLKKYLQFHGHSCILKSFYYQNSEMDFMSLYNDHLVEYEIKTCRLDYQSDFKKMVFAGKPLNKHALLKSGKFISNRFYYVCPGGLIDIEHLPDYAGLIVYHKEGNWFEIVKMAPWLHKNRVTPGFYKTLSLKLYERHEKNINRAYSKVPELYGLIVPSTGYGDNPAADSKNNTDEKDCS